MVFFVNEEKARKIFKRYEDVNAFTYVRSHKVHPDPGVTVNYTYAEGIIPDADTITAVASGEMKAKKVINKAIKLLRNPAAATGDEIDLCSSIYTILRILDEASEKRPRPIVFIAESEPADDELKKQVKKQNKFIATWLAAIFGFYGIRIFTDIKPLRGVVRWKKDKGANKDALLIPAPESAKEAIKKFFKGRRKKIAKAIREYDTDEMSDSNPIFSKRGDYIRVMSQAIRPEICYMTWVLSSGSLRDNVIDGIGKNTRNKFAHHLFAMISGADIDAYSGYKIDSDDYRKIVKSVKRADKHLARDYKSFVKIFEIMREAEIKRLGNDSAAIAEAKKKFKKLPKLPKNKKKRNKQWKKIIEFYAKKKNTYLLCALCAHLCAIRGGSDIGSSRHIKAVTEVLAVKDNVVASSFKTTTKKMAEAVKALETKKRSGE